MRRFLSFVVFVVLLFSSSLAFADIDISNLSFTELLDLQQKVNLALFNSEEWIEVEVPMGRWDVGKDIPAGKWEISCGSQFRKTHIVFYAERASDGSPNVWRGSNDIENGEVMVLEFIEGYVIDIKDGPAIFKHYVPSFSFE